MTAIKVTDREGAERALDAENNRPLMEALRDAIPGLGVAGTCGGMCSCGTCHVYVAKQWGTKLAPKTEDEQLMLDAIGELIEVRPESRLSCQIEIKDEHAGLEVQVGPMA